MKKVVLNYLVIAAIAVVAAFTSCKKDDENGDGKLSPPAWIQGELSDGSQSTFTFTSDNVVFVVEVVGINTSFKSYKNVKET